MAFSRPTPLTLADLRRALDDKEIELRELLDRKEQMAAELDELGATLEAMLQGGSASSGREAGKWSRATAAKPARAATAATATTRDARNATTRDAHNGAPKVAREGSLPAFIHAVLERVVGPLRVAEIVDAVQAAGYASKSENLNIIVSNRLAQMDDVERVERGLYQLRRDAVLSPEQAQTN
ncbi:MAG: hypothetical protein EXS13_13640 [Planctomycetes bacterium]|nr:hypothetical protein [Planctomycetota bacterium]